MHKRAWPKDNRAWSKKFRSPGPGARAVARRPCSYVHVLSAPLGKGRRRIALHCCVDQKTWMLLLQILISFLSE